MVIDKKEQLLSESFFYLSKDKDVVRSFLSLNHKMRYIFFAYRCSILSNLLNLFVL